MDQRERPRFGSTLAHFLATWAYVGHLRPAPGTWGSLAALPFGFGLAEIGLHALVIASLGVGALGIWSAQIHCRRLGRGDPAEVVIDEVVGMWICLWAWDGTAIGFAVAFVLFRLFDILKPWPISWLDRHVPGGLGVMVDDVAAGLAAAVCLWGLGTMTGWGENGWMLI